MDLGLKRMTSEWQNVPSDISGFIGFVYEIRNKINGRIYIGKKLFAKKILRDPLKGSTKKRHDRTESDWKEYWGSSVDLLADIKKYKKDNFERRILACYATKWECNYFELKEQMQRDVLRDPRYYNKYIRARMPAFRKEEYCDIS